MPSVACGDDVDFNRDIRQVLSDNCFLCHGPAASTRQADLRLDLRDKAIAQGAILPGNTDGSSLVSRIFSDDPDMVMPPPDANKTLTSVQKNLLKKWVQEGAKYQRHWAFVRPIKSIDTIEGNPVDHFIEKKLEQEGLGLSKPADLRTLIRRVSFDLTGLPPTPDQVESFLSASTQHGVDRAYENIVDQLLASSSYGERMALSWLDAARYGDTSVMHADGPRDMWPWRDWVIHAYNNNMPFDQFTIEQLAGDLLPNASASQMLASGFNRNHATSDEGGAFAEELRVEYVVDRVATTSNVWLGLTMECAQCHDHKYDPLSQEEYYQFYAYFNNTADPGMQTRKGNQSPVVEVKADMLPSAYFKQLDVRSNELTQELKHKKDDLSKHLEKMDATFREWCAAESKKIGIEGGAQTSLPGLTHWFSFDSDVQKELSDSVTGLTATLGKGSYEKVDRHASTGLRLNGGTEFTSNDSSTQLAHDKPFSFAAWIKTDGKSTGAVFSRMNVANAFRGYDFWIQGQSVGTHIIHKWSDNAIKVVSKDRLQANEWQHVVITYDGLKKASGVKIFIDGKLSENSVEADALTETIESDTQFRIGSRSQGGLWKGEVDDIRIYDRILEEHQLARVRNEQILTILATLPKDRTEQQKVALRQHYFVTHDKKYQQLQQQVDKATKQLRDFQSTKLTSMVMTDNPPEKMRKTYILARGQYDAPKKDRVISVGVPGVLPPLPKSAPGNRLGLATWLTDGRHPLTARVAINRYWSMFFGMGLVQTVSDFGAQGAVPTHPELLDWLAVEFVESGWNVKRMIKTFVLSKTYRQSSRRNTHHAQIDPENLLFSRSPRFRLQGEFIRDTALAVAGLLVDDVGGPGVKPYQPANIWNEVSLNGGLRYKQDVGQKLYRKSMYTYWKRSAPMPNMLIFDAPTREKCTIQRARTNTPLQALVTLNDPQFVEAARVFAQRLLKSQEEDSERIQAAYELVLSRPASQPEQEILLEVLQQQRTRLREHTKEAADYLSVGESDRDETLNLIEHAAWTVVAQIILNLDEALTRG